MNCFRVLRISEISTAVVCTYFPNSYSSSNVSVATELCLMSHVLEYDGKIYAAEPYLFNLHKLIKNVNITWMLARTVMFYFFNFMAINILFQHVWRLIPEIIEASFELLAT
jgi:hypothetical protein